MAEEQKEKKMTVSDILEEVSQEICEQLCKYPGEYGADRMDEMMSEKCDFCPLNRLV